MREAEKKKEVKVLEHELKKKINRRAKLRLRNKACSYVANMVENERYALAAETKFKPCHRCLIHCCYCYYSHCLQIKANSKNENENKIKKSLFFSVGASTLNNYARLIVSKRLNLCHVLCM